MKQNLKVNLVWLGLLVAGFALIQVLVAAGVLNLFYIQILEQIGINIILAVGLNLIVGFSGQFSLGHAGFMAIGAYSAAILGSKSPTYGAFFGAMVLGALIAGLVALIVGVPTLRLKGDYLAIATLGVSEIIRILIVNGGTLTNGAAGILGLPAFTTWQLVYLFVVITTIFTINFLRSPIGRSTLSVREDEIAAESVGINTTKVKVIAFVFGAITAAIAGSLQAGFIGSVVPKDYSFTNTINVLIIVVFGGLGSMSGTVVAAIKDTDFQAALTKIKDKDFDAIVLPGYYTETGKIVNQARGMGIKQPIIGGDGFSDAKFVEQATPAAATDIYYVAGFSTEGEMTDKAKKFVEAYKAKYNEEPSMFAALAYDSVYMVAEASKGAKNSVELKDNLAKLKDLEGVTGTMSIDKNHNPVKSALMIGLKDGKVKSVESVKP